DDSAQPPAGEARTLCTSGCNTCSGEQTYIPAAGTAGSALRRESLPGAGPSAYSGGESKSSGPRYTGGNKRRCGKSSLRLLFLGSVHNTSQPLRLPSRG